MAIIPTGQGDTLVIGTGPGWYIIQYPLPRTGVEQIDYTNAPNEQTAAEFNPGTTVLGGPYSSEQAAENAFNGSPQGQSYNANAHSPKSSGKNGPASTTNQQPLTWDWASIFERVGLVVLGIVLVGVGVAHATGVDSINPIGLAKKALK